MKLRGAQGVWPFLVFLLLPFTGAHAESGGLDLNRFNACDEFFCPSGGDSALQNEVYSRVGIAMIPTQSSQVSAPALIVRPVVIRGNRIQENPIAPSPSAPVQDSEPSLSSTGDVSSASSGSNYEGGSSPHTSSNTNFGQGTTRGGFSGQSRAAAPMNNGQMVGGLLYSGDDDSSQTAAKSPTASPSFASVQQNRMNFGGGTNGFAKSRAKSQQENRNSESIPALAGSRIPASVETMAVNSAAKNSGGLAQGQNATSESLIARIAKKLGLNQFFGSSPTGGSGKGAWARQQAQSKRNKGLSQAGSRLVDPKTILQRQLDKIQNRRRLASQLEFASPQSSLFQNMCQHYQDYAVANRILTNPQPCP